MYFFILFVFVGGNFKKGHWNEVAATMNSKKTEGDYAMKTAH